MIFTGPDGGQSRRVEFSRADGLPSSRRTVRPLHLAAVGSAVELEY